MEEMDSFGLSSHIKLRIAEFEGLLSISKIHEMILMSIIS